MKAAIFKEKAKLVIEEVPDPRPEADQNILKDVPGQAYPAAGPGFFFSRLFFMV